MSRPIGCPRFSIRIFSPSESHASSLEKELRKSRTDTVFILWTNYVHIIDFVNSHFASDAAPGSDGRKASGLFSPDSLRCHTLATS